MVVMAGNGGGLVVFWGVCCVFGCGKCWREGEEVMEVWWCWRVGGGCSLFCQRVEVCDDGVKERRSSSCLVMLAPGS